jgi:hypothetical protein
VLIILLLVVVLVILVIIIVLVANCGRRAVLFIIQEGVGLVELEFRLPCIFGAHVFSNDGSVPIPIQGELEFARGLDYVRHFRAQLHTAKAHSLFESVLPHVMKADEDPPLLPSVLVDLVRPRLCVDLREEVVNLLDDDRCPRILVEHLALVDLALMQELSVVRVVLVNDPGIVGLEVISVSSSPWYRNTKTCSKLL